MLEGGRFGYLSKRSSAPGSGRYYRGGGAGIVEFWWGLALLPKTMRLQDCLRCIVVRGGSGLEVPTVRLPRARGSR